MLPITSPGLTYFIVGSLFLFTTFIHFTQLLRLFLTMICYDPLCWCRELTLRGPFCKWTAMSSLESMKVGGCQIEETPFLMCFSEKPTLFFVNKSLNFSADTPGTCVVFEENDEHGKWSRWWLFTLQYFKHTYVQWILKLNISCTHCLAVSNHTILPHAKKSIPDTFEAPCIHLSKFIFFLWSSDIIIYLKLVFFFPIPNFILHMYVCTKK